MATLDRQAEDLSVPEQAITRPKFWFPSAVVFISNICIMILELVASRIMAPIVGVSLYTWTSIIGVVLAGISIGNFLGGKLADRWASPRLLALIFGLGSLSSLLVLGMTIVMETSSWPGQFPLIIKILIITGFIFLLPSIIMGMISPIVVKLSLQDLSQTGNTVGRIYAFSALGSIAGTFLTGFWLISTFGTSAIVLIVAGIMALMALWFAVGNRAWIVGSVLVLLFTSGWVWASKTPEVWGSCLIESNYFCIKVRDREIDGANIKVLILDRLVHSYAEIGNPRRLVYGYEKAYAALTRIIAQRKPDFRAFFIGGGGYTFPRYLEALYPQSRSVVAEIDPAVTKTAFMYLGLPLTTTVQTYNEDARQFVNRTAPISRFDIVYGDAFNDYSVPYHLTTEEFNREIYRFVGTDGIFMVNVIDGRASKFAFVRSYIKTLQKIFKHVYLIPTSVYWEDSVRSTFVIAAMDWELDVDAFQQSENDPEKSDIYNLTLTQTATEQFLQNGPYVILTDQFAPVDNILAAVASDSDSPSSGK